MQPLDTVVFQTPMVKAAQFRCSPLDPRFRDSGPAGNYAIVFPRTAVWLRYSGSRSFVADSSVATIYNPGQEYSRSMIDQRGDECDWFGVSESLALDIATSLNPECAETPERPLSAQHARVGRDLYLAQRTLFNRLQKNSVDSLEAEETIVGLVTAVLRNAFDERHTASRMENEARIDLVHRARAVLSRTVFESLSLGELARELAVSPFHLCRVFRTSTGQTLHEFKTELRLRAALAELGNRSRDLSRIALQCGFASHSHFTVAMRRRFGQTPSALREVLSA